MNPLTDPCPHLFWITSLAAGNLALVLSSLSVGLGLLMATRELKHRGPDLRIVHETLSLVTIVALGVHGISLIGDRFMHPTLANVLIPFSWSYKTGWVSAGIIAGWAMVLLGPTYYVRRRIGAARWRSLHRLVAVAWIAGVVHALGMGTDAGQTWFLVMTSTVVGPAALLLLARWLKPPPPKAGVAVAGATRPAARATGVTGVTGASSTQPSRRRSAGGMPRR
jgi:methionine sulfoxide reductase heme-binding subunit